MFWLTPVPLLQAGNPSRNRYEAARDFVPPGRLMFLRPIKSAAKERKSNRKYMPVWITAQVSKVTFDTCLHPREISVSIIVQVKCVTFDTCTQA